MSVTAAAGFVASGMHCGIRRKRPDLCIVRSLEPAVGGGMFTRNRVKAAPVLVNQEHLAQAEPQAIVANSGVANAATGERGKLNTLATAAEAARLLELSAEEVLVLSTGVVGVQLPMGTLLPALPTVVDALSPDGGADAAEAIMTTDTRPKEKAIACDGFSVGGMAKGSGMIHPDLATMLAVITTDYPLEPGEPREVLLPAVNPTFNAITIDGDCSTNDTVLLLANGASGVERTAARDKQFEEALLEVCDGLAREIVADGEGVTVVATITVTGAVDDAQAKAIAQRIAISPLVKTALFGHDPNWGRVLVAAGSAPFEGRYADLDPELASLSYNGTPVLTKGSPEDVRPDVSGPSCTIDLELGLGTGNASYLTSDLTYDYVRINAEYTT
ncbi:MAG: bifunctional glutamate N-acetyltransferase/amino-acid acetyltransferase ArgJ [Gaiellaceae bacterium]